MGERSSGHSGQETVGVQVRDGEDLVACSRRAIDSSETFMELKL